MTLSAADAIDEADGLLRVPTGVGLLGYARARTLLNYASVLQQQEGLARATASAQVQEEQLSLQRKLAGPLEKMAALVEEIAKTEDGKWSAGVVNDWIREARGLIELTPKEQS